MGAWGQLGDTLEDADGAVLSVIYSAIGHCRPLNGLAMAVSKAPKTPRPQH